MNSKNDQNRISPYNINTISINEVLRMKKDINKGSLDDPMPNSPNNHHKKPS